MSTMTYDLPVYREPVSPQATRPRAVPERVGFWRGLWNTIKNSAIFVATARAVDGVISWFTSGEATHTVGNAVTWVRSTASSFWNMATGWLRRPRPEVAEAAAAPFRWLSWAGLWTMAGIAAGFALVVTGFNWVADRWNNRNSTSTPVTNARTAHNMDRDPMVEPRTASGTPTPEDMETFTIKGVKQTVPSWDPSDMNTVYNWKRYFQVDNLQGLADLIYGNEAQVKELLNRIEQIDQDHERLNAFRAINTFLQSVDFNAPHNHEFLSHWYGRLDCYAEFVEEGTARFFNTDEDVDEVISLQQRAEYHANRHLAQRKNKNPNFRWFHKPGYLKGFLAQGKELEAKYTVAGQVA